MKLTSLQKTLKLIEILSEAQGPQSISSLSGLTGLPGSSLHHMLSTLKDGGYVTQNPETKKYALGFKFLTISRRVLDGIDLRQVAGATLRELNARTGEAVFLSVLRGNRVLFIEKIQANDGKIPLATDIGFTSDPHASSSGKVLLCEQSETQLLEIFPHEELPRIGPRTIGTRTELLRHLELVRLQGYALDDEEYYRGIRCVAAPVRVGGKTLASVSMTGSVFSMTFEMLSAVIVPQVRQAADRISVLMGGA